MDLGITGKVALITGGSRGLGRQSALALASEGVNVAICGRTNSSLDSTVKEIEEFGVDVVGILADVTELDDIRSLHSEVCNSLGAVDILVNNAGGSLSREDIQGTSLDDFKKTFDLNVFGGFELMKLAIPHMKENKWGRIINIASIYGREYGGNISYMSAKAALIAATKHSAISLAKDGILVNSIAPGLIETDMIQVMTEEQRNAIAEATPMKRLGQPEEIAELAAFLLSERASFTTGQCYIASGGRVTLP